MENTNDTNMIDQKGGKNNMMTIIIVVIILAIIATIMIKNKKVDREVEVTPQSNIELENTINDDTTTKINENLNKIDLSDTSNDDLKSIDEELNKL